MHAPLFARAPEGALRLQKCRLALACIALLACSRDEKAPQPAPPKPAFTLDRPTEGLVASPRDERFMRGVTLGPLLTEGSESAQQASLVQTLDAVRELGATDIEFVVEWAQADPAAVEFSPLDETIENERLEWLMDAAHARGLRVMLTPLLVLEQGGSARPNPSEADSERWWWSYRRIAIAYGRIAGQHHAWGFNVGADLPGMARDKTRLEALLTDVRKVFKGKLGYVVKAADLESAQIWSLLDFAAVGSARGPEVAATLADAQLAAELKGEAQAIAKFAEATHKEVVLTESLRSVTSPDVQDVAPLAWLRFERARYNVWQNVPALQGVFTRGVTLGKRAAAPEPALAVTRFWYQRATDK